MPLGEELVDGYSCGGAAWTRDGPRQGEHRMNWTMLGAVGELVGAVVVALTLFYLARQTHMSNRMAQAEGWRTLSTSYAEMNMMGIAIPEFRAGFAKVMYGDATRDDLDVDERVAVGLFYDAALNVYQQAFREVALGLLPKQALEDLTSRAWEVPYFKSVWPVLRAEYSDDFVAFVEARYRARA
jgi:hypothetical protein